MKDINQGDKGFSVGFSPLSTRGLPVWAVYLMAVLGALYLLNPTAGFIELIPDNLPWVGNIDEGAAALAVWYGVLELKNARKRKIEKR